MKAFVVLSSLTLAAAFLTSCENRNKPEESRTATTAAAAPAEPAPQTDKSGAANTAPAAANAAAEDNLDIPSEVDFEDQAAQSITADNAERELAKMEKEIGTAKVDRTGTSTTK